MGKKPVLGKRGYVDPNESSSTTDANETEKKRARNEPTSPTSKTATAASGSGGTTGTTGSSGTSSAETEDNGTSSSSDDTQKKVKKLKIRLFGHFVVGHGLSNLGNTCYMNSILQMLCHLPKFKEEMAKIQYKIDEEGQPFLFALKDLIA